MNPILRPLLFATVFVLVHANILTAQIPDIQRVEPMFWWTGMQNPALQLLVYGKDIANSSVSLKYAGVELKGVLKTESPNYLFVNLHISPEAKAGTLALMFTSGKKERSYSYELRAKSTDRSRIQGLNAADVIYMLMPDRFANGDPKNDKIAGMPDIMHRDSLHARHGGDIQGIINHLDYIKDLGCTAIWSTPLLENNMERYSYHGYAITDYYKIDARFGSNELYKQYVDKAHSMGLKIVKDMVLNHCGDAHWFIKDPPALDWAHSLADYKTNPAWKKEYPRGNYRASTLTDPYAAQSDKHSMSDTWFDSMMPDMNQQNPLLATYFIQNSIWWVEYAGIDGIRMDTYPYPDKDFTAQWAKAVMTEYPQFYIVGEVWINDVGMSAYWQSNTRNKDGFVSNLPATTDFPLNFALSAAFNENESWDTGLIKLYNVLASDFQYTDANNNVIFLDNHDLNRYFTAVKEDMRKLKMALTVLLTTRGVPQVYYETELAMPGVKDPDPLVRKDFPGGWANDSANGRSASGFTEKGRSVQQNEAFNYFRTLAQWRKIKPVVHTGKLTHFIPQDGVYTYFRHNNSEAIMVMLNNNDKDARTVKTNRFRERTAGFIRAKNVITGEVLSDISSVTVPAKSALVLELMK